MLKLNNKNKTEIENINNKEEFVTLLRAAVPFGDANVANTKRILEITINNDGTTNMLSSESLDLGNRGDNNITRLDITLPTNFITGYNYYVISNLTAGIYISACSAASEGVCTVLISENLALQSGERNMLFCALEDDETETSQEVFVSDIFSGTIKDNFLPNDWKENQGPEVSEDLVVDETFTTPDPTEYSTMTWVNGETKLNAANMNNIILGIDSKQEELVSGTNIKTINSESLLGSGDIILNVTTDTTLTQQGQAADAKSVGDAINAIPTVPTISTDIANDAESNIKTASPKAVKDYVDNQIGNINTILDSINGEVI